ncbi:MAG: radical SAM protein [Deltaproteobacteria bacterium]|nr:radical SAM protein [Deltaproteobacteria bacterium]
MKKNDTYQGFELGPIRPPSEAHSLLLRITRNCPWNKCKFCGLYKGKKFSKRPVAHIKQDIDKVRHYIDKINNITQESNKGKNQNIMALLAETPHKEQAAFQAALSWFRGGMKSIFLQDANSLIIKPDDLVEILNYIKDRFPQVERITSYARSHTIARISNEDMVRFASAGLNRIHIGMESAANEVLDFVKKGVDKQTHIKAGQRVKQAGIELSEYFMPGLGGTDSSRVNALETADAINQINPDFIRIRTLAVPDFSNLANDIQEGTFTKPNDVETAQELLLFLENLDGINSTIKSDHILNLFQEVEGVLPQDKSAMIAPIKNFLAMPPEKQMIYRVGRRTGIFSNLNDLNNSDLVRHAEAARARYDVNTDTVDEFTDKIMKQFI